MNLVNGTQQFVGNNPLAVGPAGKPIRVFNINLTTVTGASTLKLYNGTSAVAGNQYAQVDGAAAAKGYNQTYLVGKLFPSGCYLSTDANSQYVTVDFSIEV